MTRTRVPERQSQSRHSRPVPSPIRAAIWRSGCGRWRAGRHAPAVPDRAAALTAMAPGRVVRNRGVHAGCGRRGGPRPSGLGGPIHGARSGWYPGAHTAVLILVPAALRASAAAWAVRFARSSGAERLQLKWFVTAAVLVVAAIIPLALAPQIGLSPAATSTGSSPGRWLTRSSPACSPGSTAGWCYWRPRSSACTRAVSAAREAAKPGG